MTGPTRCTARRCRRTLRNYKPTESDRAHPTRTVSAKEKFAEMLEALTVAG